MIIQCKDCKLSQATVKFAHLSVTLNGSLFPIDLKDTKLFGYPALTFHTFTVILLYMVYKDLW